VSWPGLIHDFCLLSHRKSWMAGPSPMAIGIRGGDAGPTGHAGTAGTAGTAMLPDFNFVAMNRLSPIDNGPRDCHQSLTIKDVNQG
jgi:hypothetical protein